MSSYARIGLVAAAVVVAVAVGIGLLGRPSEVGPPSGPTPSLAPSSSPVANPLLGTWLGADVTCEQQNAAIEAAGFTAEQIAASGVVCANGSTNQYSIQFGSSLSIQSFRIFDKGVLAFPGSYEHVSETTFEVLSQGGDMCLTYRYAIDGDQLSVVMTDRGCPLTGEAPLNDQVAQTAIFETSPFTRQP